MGYVHQWTFRRKKEDVSREKVDIQQKKVDIGIVFPANGKDLSDKIAARCLMRLGLNIYFGGAQSVICWD